MLSKREGMMNPQIDFFQKQDQIKNLERVKSKLMGAVIDFCRNVEKNIPSGIFNMRDLVMYCIERVHCSFDSPSRILRLASEEKELKYEVISRSKSRYKIIWVK